MDLKIRRTCMKCDGKGWNHSLVEPFTAKLQCLECVAGLEEFWMPMEEVFEKMMDFPIK